MGIGIGTEALIGALFGGGEVAADLGIAGADLGLDAAAAGATDLAGAGAIDAAGAGAEAIDAAAAGGAVDAAGTGAAEAGAIDTGLTAADAAGAAGAAGAVDTLAPQSATQALNFASAAPGATSTGATGALNGANLASIGEGSANVASLPSFQSASTELASGNPTLAAELGQLPPANLNTGPSAIEAVGGSSTPLDIANLAADPTAAPAAGQVAPQSAADALNGAGVAPDRPIFNNGVETGIPGVGPTAQPDTGGLSAGVSNFLNSPYTKAAELALPVGFLGYNLLKGPPPLPSQATAAVENAKASIGPLQGQATQNVPLFNQTAAQDLSLANNFQISPAQAASIQIFVQNAQNQLRQQIANQGNQNVEATSEWAQGNQQIQQQALSMQVQMVNQLISTAFQAASAANAGVSTAVNATSSLDSTLMQAAQIQVQQDTAFQQSITGALQSFGMLAALSNLKVTGATQV